MTMPVGCGTDVGVDGIRAAGAAVAGTGVAGTGVAGTAVAVGGAVATDAVGDTDEPTPGGTAVELPAGADGAVADGTAVDATFVAAEAVGFTVGEPCGTVGVTTAVAAGWVAVA